MKKFLCGLAVIPFMATAAFAQPNTGQASPQPVQLSESQMDNVTAGWTLLETDISNTSWTRVSVYREANTISCSACYLLINNSALSVGSIMLSSLGSAE